MRADRVRVHYIEQTLMLVLMINGGQGVYLFINSFLTFSRATLN